MHIQIITNIYVIIWICIVTIIGRIVVSWLDSHTVTIADASFGSPHRQECPQHVKYTASPQNTWSKKNLLTPSKSWLSQP